MWDIEFMLYDIAANYSTGGRTLDLEQLKQIRDMAEARMKRPRIVVNMGSGGIMAGAGSVLDAVSDELHKRQLDVELVISGSLGLLALEPVMEVIVPGRGRTVYTLVDPDKARVIISNHIVNGQPITNWTVKAD